MCPIKCSEPNKIRAHRCLKEVPTLMSMTVWNSSGTQETGTSLFFMNYFNAFQNISLFFMKQGHLQKVCKKVQSVKLFQARKKMWTCDIEVDTWLRQVCGVSLVTGTKYLCMVSWYCNINNDYDLSGPARWAGCCSPCRYCRHNNLHFTSHSLITHC